MPQTSVRWSQDKNLDINLPDNWQILGQYAPHEPEPVDDLSGKINQSLQKPLGRPSLAQLLNKTQKIALIIDDLTRPTPVQELAGPILAALADAGISDQQVTGIVATGLHPPLSQEQMLKKIGPELDERFTWIQNDCRNSDRYALLGTVPYPKSKRKQAELDIHVLQEIAQADMVILIGSVCPHVQAGFGGGLKLLVPGCAHSATITPLHKIGLNGDIAKLVGQQPQHNQMRSTVEKIGDLLGQKVFSISVLLDSAGRVSCLQAGDPQQVQQQLSMTCEQESGLLINKPADVAVISAFPLDYDLLQGFKCIVNTRLAARKGGILIGILNLRTVGHLKLKVSFVMPTGLFQFLLKLTNIEYATKFWSWMDKGLDVEAKFFMRLALETIKRNRVLIYCPEMARAKGKFPYVEVFADLQALVDRADKLLGRPTKASVNVFAEGGASYPRLKAD